MDKATKLINKINDKIFEKMDNLPKELINQYIGELSNLKTELSKIVIEEVRKELKSTNKTNKISYLREEKDLKRLEENKKKISKLLSVDNNIKSIRRKCKKRSLKNSNCWIYATRFTWNDKKTYMQ